MDNNILKKIVKYAGICVYIYVNKILCFGYDKLIFKMIAF